MAKACAYCYSGEEHDDCVNQIGKPDTSLETFWEAREYIEGMQEYFSDEYGDEDDRVRQTAHIWVLLNDACTKIHGQGVG